MLEKGGCHIIVGNCLTIVIYIKPKKYNDNHMIEVLWQIRKRIDIAIFARV